MNWLETGVCISNIIYESIVGLPLYIYDLWISWKPASVYLWFMNRMETGVYISMIYEPLFLIHLYKKISNSFIQENFEEKPLNIPSWKSVWKNQLTASVEKGCWQVRKLVGYKDLGCRDVPLSLSGFKPVWRPCHESLPSTSLQAPGIGWTDIKWTLLVQSEYFDTYIHTPALKVLSTTPLGTCAKNIFYLVKKLFALFSSD